MIDGRSSPFANGVRGISSPLKCAAATIVTRPVAFRLDDKLTPITNLNALLDEFCADLGSARHLASRGASAGRKRDEECRSMRRSGLVRGGLVKGAACAAALYACGGSGHPGLSQAPDGSGSGDNGGSSGGDALDAGGGASSSSGGQGAGSSGASTGGADGGGSSSGASSSGASADAAASGGDSGTCAS